MVRDDYVRDRSAYEKRKTEDASAVKPNTEDYWRTIPGEMFLLNGSEIATVNVRHVRPVGVLKPENDQELLKAFAELRDQISKHLAARVD